jgi:two-component system sensor histidine kinase YesM
VDRIKVFNSLRVKLGIFAVVLIAIPVSVIYFTYNRTVKEIIKNKYTETAIQSVFEASEKLNFILDDVQKFSTVIISNSELLNMLDNKDDYRADEFGRVLRNFITSRDDIEVIDLVLKDAYYTAGAKKINRIDRINQRLEDSSGQPLWLPTKVEQIEVLSGKFNKNYFTLARKIINFNTLKDYGYLLIDLEEVLLEQAYSRLLDNGKAEVLICDDKGNIISHSKKEKIGSSINEETYGKAVLDDITGHNYVQYKINIDKVAIYSTIRNNGWKIIKTVPTDYLYEELNNIQKYLIIGGIIYGIVIIIYILLFSIRYTEPMMKMMSVIKKVEQGDLTVRTEVKSNDEVGQLGSSLNNMIGEMQVLIDKLIKEEQEKKKVELEALHAQINPHFLYNTLNTIKWMAKIQGNNSVSKAITALVKLLRISTNLDREMITLQEEIDYVKNYIVIQKLRFNRAINISYNIDDKYMKLTVPKLILQPIVENSIIHGMEAEEDNLNIVIDGFVKEEKLIIEISDDGPGIEDEIMKVILKDSSDRNKFSKVGLNNVNQRIKLYCGGEFGLKIETEYGKGTKVIVVLPVISLHMLTRNRY